MKKRLCLAVLAAMLLALCLTWAQAEESTAPGELSWGSYTYRLLPDGTAEITGYTGMEKELVIPGELDGHTVTAIGDEAFSDDRLTRAVIPDSVTQMGESVFLESVFDESIGLRTYRSALTSIHLGSGIDTIYTFSSSFQGFSAAYYPDLAVITVSPENPVYVVENGLLIDRRSAEVVCCPAKLTGEIVVPDWITAIRNEAFVGSHADSVYIPDSVRTLGDSVFTGSSIRRIRLPGGLALAFVQDGRPDEDAIFPSAITDERMQKLLEGRTNKEKRTLMDSYKEYDPAKYRKKDDVAALEAAYPALKDGTVVWVLRKAADTMRQNDIFKMNRAFEAAGYTLDDLVLDHYLTTGTELVIPERIDPYPMVKKPPFVLRESLLNGLAIPAGCGLENLQGAPAILWAIQKGYTLVGVQFCGDYAYTVQADGTAKIVGYLGEGGNIVIPGELDGYIVTALGHDALNDALSPEVLAPISSIYDGGRKVPNIAIPDSVTVLEGNPFRNCSKLTGVIIAGSNPALTVVDGVLYTDGGRTLLCWLRGQETKTLTIPSGVERIAERAFENNTKLQELHLPAGLTEIGAYAFSGCTALKTVTIGEGLQALGVTAFSSCTALEEISLPDSVTHLGLGVFAGCTALKAIDLPAGLTEIAARAFRGCEALEEIVMPEGLTTIGEYAFIDCTALKAIDLPAGLTEIGARAFRGCEALEEIVMPEGLTTIGEYAFEDCTALKHVVFPRDLQWLGYPGGDDAFSHVERVTLPADVSALYRKQWSGFPSVTSIVIPDYTTELGEEFSMFHSGNLNIAISPEHPTIEVIDGVLFERATKRLLLCPSGLQLTSYEVPEGTTAIGPCAFAHCGSLTSITIPDSVTEIGDYAFGNCGLTSVIVPDSVTKLGESAFGDCYQLREAWIGCGVTSIGEYTFYCCTALKNLCLPAGVTSISAGAFQSCTSLTELILPEGLTSMGEQALYDCKSLTGMVIPAGVTSIGKKLFSDCTALTAVTIPDTVTSISESAFAGCTALTVVTIPDTVTSISESAFAGCTALTAMTIPDSVTSIGALAFTGCTSLAELILPEGLTSMGEGALKDCPSLTSLALPADLSLYSNALIGDSELHVIRTVTIPDSMKPLTRWDERIWAFVLEEIRISPDHPTMEVIDGVLFDKLTGDLLLYPAKRPATSYTVPAGTTGIADFAFCWAEDLVEVTLPESLTSIGAAAFSGCSSLTSIALPESLTSLGAYALPKGLTELTVPADLNVLLTAEGLDFSGVTAVTLPDGLTEIDGNPFRGWTQLANIYVPQDHPALATIDGVLFSKADRRLVCYPCAFSVTSYVIPQGILEIGSEAFAGCEGLNAITIPASVAAIAADAFTGCSPDLVFTVTRNSWAARWCEENGWSFISPSGADWLFN